MNLSNYDQIKDDVFVSRFQGLSLEQYIEARSLFCKSQHKKTCQDCCLQLNVAKYIKQEGYITLKHAFEMCSPGVTYTSNHAKRKLLQMPCTNYAVFQALLNEVLAKTVETRVSFVTKDELKCLLALAESEAEKERIKYAVVKSAGMSADKANKVFGFHNMNRRAEAVELAYKEACDIKDSIMNIAHLKDRALLGSFRLQDTISDDENSDSEDDDELLEQPKGQYNYFADEKQVEDDNSSNCISQQNVLLDVTGEIKSEDILDVLKQTKFNWFALEEAISQKFPLLSKDTINQSLSTISEQLPCLPNLSKEDNMLLEQSRQAFIFVNQSSVREKDLQDGLIVSDSDSSDAEVWQKGISNVFDNNGRLLIEKKRASLKRKTVRVAKRRIMEKRFLRRRRSQRVGKIIKECPGIGEVIEEYVAQCGAGADAWRRTGVVTFDGNKKVQKKATFKRIKAFLEEKYKRNFAYGTVVQMCIARNKRRRSAGRYKGLAKVVHRRARKGFNFVLTRIVTGVQRYILG